MILNILCFCLFRERLAPQKNFKVHHTKVSFNSLQKEFSLLKSGILQENDLAKDAKRHLINYKRYQWTIDMMGKRGASLSALLRRVEANSQACDQFLLKTEQFREAASNLKKKHKDLLSSWEQQVSAKLVDLGDMILQLTTKLDELHDMEQDCVDGKCLMSV